MSNPQDRAPSKKRPLSPSSTPGPSSAWPTTTTTSRKTSRPNHEISSAVRETIRNLDSQQLRDVINQLVNFHPSARETIGDILPTLKPSQTPAVFKNTESIYFKRQVNWCGYILADSWVRHLTMPKADACDIVSRVVRYEILSIGNSITDYDAGRNHCSEGEYFVDAAIAVLDIGFSMLKRTKRLAKPNHPLVECSCVCVDSSPAYSCCASVKYCPVVMSYYLIYGTLRKVKPYLAEIQRHGEGDERDDDEDYWA